MKIAVVGCGGIGGVIAGVLADGGRTVHCIDSVGEAVRVMNERGLHISGRKGDFTVPVRAYTDIASSPGPFDLIVLAVKSAALRAVFEEASRHLSGRGFILTIQNGIEILRITAEYPDIPVIMGAVGYNSVMTGFGECTVTAEGGITAGVLNGCSNEDLHLLKELFDPRIVIATTENPEGVLWSKLIIVCGVTGLGGVAGLRIGKLLKHGTARKLFYEVVTEGSLLARRLGIKIEKLGGAINPEKFGTHDRGYPLFIRYLLLKIVGMKFKNLKSNIHHSLDRGEKTEVGFINGAVVRAGREVNFPTPFNQAIVDIVGEIEEGKRTMSADNLKVILERTGEE